MFNSNIGTVLKATFGAGVGVGGRGGGEGNGMR